MKPLFYRHARYWSVSWFTASALLASAQEAPIPLSASTMAQRPKVSAVPVPRDEPTKPHPLRLANSEPAAPRLTLVKGNVLKMRVDSVDKKYQLKSVLLTAPGTVTVAGRHNPLTDAWIFRVVAEHTGNAAFSVRALHAQDPDSEAAGMHITPATIEVDVEDPIHLPPASSDAGLLVRLLLAESLSPYHWARHGIAGLEQVKRGMQLMRNVVENRAAYKKPRAFAATGHSVRDIVTAHEGAIQWAGFDHYPQLPRDLDKNLRDVVDVCNDATNPWREQYKKYLLVALEVATSPAPPDPSQSGLFGWRTAHHGSPGGAFQKFKTVAGNDFFTHSEIARQ